MLPIFYHNPKCSKSRKALQLLEERNIPFQLKEYLKEPLAEAEILNIFQKLLRQGHGLDQMIRMKEDFVQENHWTADSFPLEKWAKIITEHPFLLERPLLVFEDQAYLGRPEAENILPENN